MHRPSTHPTPLVPEAVRTGRARPPGRQPGRLTRRRSRSLAVAAACVLAVLIGTLAPAHATERAPGTAPPPVVTAQPDAAAPSATVAGIDVANYQHPNGAAIDWNQVKAAGNEYVFIKATEGPISCTGTYYTNSYFKGDWAGAGNAGLYRGAYHFARPLHPLRETAVDQARFFVSTTGPMSGFKDLPPVLDFEVTCGLSPADLATWAHHWLDEVYRLTGRRAAITSYPAFWSGPMANNTTFGDYPLWIARYGTPSPYPLLAGWDDWTWWQTGQDTEPGIVGQVDQNLFNGNLNFLARYGAVSSPYPTSPIGRYETATVAGMDEITVSGWALDADTQDPITVDVWVDGVLADTVDANEFRWDVGLFFWIWGAEHGFRTRLEGLAPGTHNVCVWAHNTGPGIDVDMGCKSVTMPTGPPVGSLELVGWRPSGWQIDGWALDPDTAAAVQVDVVVDGVVAHSVTADGARPDVGAFFPDWGPDHGFSFRYWGTPGPHELCVVARGVAPGGDTTLGCRSLTTPGPNPVGGLLLVTNTPNGGAGSQLRVVGWALDPDNGASLPITVTVDGVPSATATADIDIPVLGHFFTGFGSRHGFDLTANLAPGAHQVCVIAHNVGTGADTTLGCGTQTG